MKQRKKNQSGFTIIEVVLVLAIAGLIFLVVFLALPQLQRSRRDAARRDLVGRVIASLEQYATNNSGSYPNNTAGVAAGTFGNFVTASNYFGTCTSAVSPYDCPSFSDPTSGGITVALGAGAAPSGAGNLRYARNATCGASGAVSGGGGTRQAAVSIALEQGGAFCQDNTD